VVHEVKKRWAGDALGKENRGMHLEEVPVRDVRPLIAEAQAGLLALLVSLRDADWAAPEAGPTRPLYRTVSVAVA
jgi:hypothetical protein